MLSSANVLYKAFGILWLQWFGDIFHKNAVLGEFNQVKPSKSYTQGLFIFWIVQHLGIRNKGIKHKKRMISDRSWSDLETEFSNLGLL